MRTLIAHDKDEQEAVVIAIALNFTNTRVAIMKVPAARQADRNPVRIRILSAQTSSTSQSLAGLANELKLSLRQFQPWARRTFIRLA